jgi:peptidylprolyl isomerase domain and WD repeat-containing protein 1
MPIPADPSSVGGVREKRKGSFVNVKCREVAYQDPLALSHEKLYPEHLPAADRYFKSFMHRDVINFNIITKCVF